MLDAMGSVIVSPLDTLPETVRQSQLRASIEDAMATAIVCPACAAMMQSGCDCNDNAIPSSE